MELRSMHLVTYLVSNTNCSFALDSNNLPQTLAYYKWTIHGDGYSCVPCPNPFHIQCLYHASFLYHRERFIRNKQHNLMRKKVSYQGHDQFHEWYIRPVPNLYKYQDNIEPPGLLHKLKAYKHDLRCTHWPKGRGRGRMIDFISLSDCFFVTSLNRRFMNSMSTNWKAKIFCLVRKLFPSLLKVQPLFPDMCLLWSI